MGSSRPLSPLCSSRPHALRTLFGVAVLVLPLTLLALLANFVLGKAIQSTVTLLFINVIAVVSIGIYSGNTGIMSFGHVAFMNIGAHISALLTMPPAQKALQLPELPPNSGRRAVRIAAGDCIDADCRRTPSCWR